MEVPGLLPQKPCLDPNPSTTEDLPDCARNCLWYEAGTDQAACQNRKDFICDQYREEVFGRAKSDWDREPIRVSHRF
jgi:hypothetical protein